MQKISNNPFRMIGVLAGATEREIQRQKGRINAMFNVGQAAEFDTDMPFEPKPERTPESVESALSQIQLNEGRIRNSLFWFVKEEGEALDQLKAGNIAAAEEIWKHAVAAGANGSNWAACNNYGTLRMAQAFQSGASAKDHLSEGILIKLKMIDSDGFADFIHLVADETSSADPESVAREFAEVLMEQVPAESSITPNELAGIFTQAPDNLRKHLASQFSESPIQELEHVVENTRKARKESPELALEKGQELFVVAKEKLALIRSSLSEGDLQYEVIADSAAKEVLQCGIDHHHKNANKPAEAQGEKVMMLFKSARSIAVGEQTRERIDENIEGLQEWLDDQPDMEKFAQVSEQAEAIGKAIEKLNSSDSKLSTADNFVSYCTPLLTTMQEKLGAEDEYFIRMSSQVVQQAMNMVIDVVNASTRNLDYQIKVNRNSAIREFKTTISKAWGVTQKLGKFKMNEQAREHYAQNRTSLSKMKNQVSSAGSASGTSGANAIWIILVLALILLRVCAAAGR